jgi:hypothetical protein
MDRLFRLFREDQVAVMRQALEDCDSPPASGPRPLVFKNVSVEGYGFDKGHSPFFQLCFDVPDRVRNMPKDSLVRIQPRPAPRRIHSQGCTGALHPTKGIV